MATNVIVCAAYPDWQTPYTSHSPVLTLTVEEAEDRDPALPLGGTAETVQGRPCQWSWSRSL